MTRTIFFLLLSVVTLSQDRNYLQKICSILSSKEYAGRGYTNYHGDKNIGIEKSRKFIIEEIKNIGAYDLNQYVKQTKNFTKTTKPINLHFSKKISSPKIEITGNNILSSYLNVNGNVLVLGKDYLPDASAPSIDFSGTLYKIDSVHYLNKDKTVLIQIEPRLMHSSSQKQENIAIIYINKEYLKNSEAEIQCQLKIQSKLEKIKTDNIYAFIPGTQYPDSFIVFTAHYDHLGNIDTTYFPGANDNASGVAVLLDLMRYFKEHPAKYSVAFYFFTGEEIGLLGSEYYVKNPLFNLNRIKVLINLDLMGGGSEGIMVVNGKVFEKEFELLNSINKEKNYQLIIKSRGRAKNSDHYWFTEKGVKSFFIYTMGDIKAYHNTDDRAENLKFTNYEKIFVLIVEWIKGF